MGSCLSILGQCLQTDKPPAHQQSQQQGTNQQAHGNALSHVAAAAGTALLSLADQLESQSPTAAASLPSPPELNLKYTIESAFVYRMPDGDTLNVDYLDSSGNKASARVRLQGIDCPESAQNFGPEACEIGKKMVFKKNVKLYVHTVDRYQRLVASVITDQNLDYSKEMLKAGAAWHYRQYDKRDELADLESNARSEKIGLWAYPRPREPWKYRAAKRQQQKT